MWRIENSKIKNWGFGTHPIDTKRWVNSSTKIGEVSTKKKTVSQLKFLNANSINLKLIFLDMLFLLMELKQTQRKLHLSKNGLFQLI